MVPTPHRSLLSILRAEASQEKTGEGALPPEIRQSIVTLSETREFFQEVATTKNNNNNAPPPAVGILELTNKTKQNKTAAAAIRPRKKQGQTLRRFNLRRAPTARQPRTGTQGAGFPAARTPRGAPGGPSGPGNTGSRLAPPLEAGSRVRNRPGKGWTALRVAFRPRSSGRGWGLNLG